MRRWATVPAMVSLTSAWQVDRAYLQTCGVASSPSSADHCRAHHKSSPLLTLSLASNAKSATYAMTKIGRVSRAQHRPKPRCPHHLWQKRVSSVCPFLYSLYISILHRRYLCLLPELGRDYVTWSLIGCVYECSSNYTFRRRIHTHTHCSPH